MKFLAKVENGSLKFTLRTAYENFKNSLEGKFVWIEMYLWEEGATFDQHGYYRATNRWLIDNTEDFAGWMEEEVHAYALQKHATFKRMIQKGKKMVEVSIVEHTRDMSKSRMARFITEFHAELGLAGIPVPSSEDAMLQKYRSRKDTK